MALSNDEIAGALRLKLQAERELYGSWDLINAAQSAVERMRDIVDPPAVRHLREMHEQMLAITDPPYLRELRAANQQIESLFKTEHVKTLADAFAGVKLFDSELFGGSVSAAVAEKVKLLAPPQDHLAGLKALMPSDDLSSIIARSLCVDDDAREAVARTAKLLGSFEIPDYVTEMRQLSAMSLEAQKLLGSLDVQHGLADLLGVHSVTRSIVEYETGRLNRAYAGFSASIAGEPEWLSTSPEFLVTAPAVAVFSQARFLRSVTTHDDIEEETAAAEIWTGVKDRTLGYIEAVLPELSPKLMKSWGGVWDAARRRGPDWARQAAASLRFILIEVLDTVAPVNALTDIPKQYERDGKFGRPAQVYWLCAPLQNRTYGRVARADLESAISIVDAMSEAVHRHDYIEIEDAFDTMAVRASIALSNLLKLWKVRN